MEIKCVGGRGGGLVIRQLHKNSPCSSETYLGTTVDYCHGNHPLWRQFVLNLPKRAVLYVNKCQNYLHIIKEKVC